MHRQLRMLSIVAAGTFLPVVLLAQAPKGATAKCKDGTYTTATSKHGMCSSHGGVAQLVTARKSVARHPTAGSATASTRARTTRTRARTTTAAKAKSATPSTRASTTTTRTRARMTARTAHKAGSTATTHRTATRSTHRAATKPATPPPAAARRPATTEHVPTIAAPATAPAGATAMCTDGTFSTSKVRTGACSHHGGVKDWLQSSH